MATGEASLAGIFRECNRLPHWPEIELDRLVEIDPDYHLHYSEIIKAIGACSGGLDQSGVPVRFVSRFNFAERRNP